MSTIRIHYTSDFNVVLPEKYVTLPGDYYFLQQADLPTPILKGFEFVGWYFDSDYEFQAIVGSRVDSDTELFAKWNQTEVSITTGLGQKQFRIMSLEENEQLRIDDPNTGNIYTLVAGDIRTTGGLTAAKLIDEIDEKYAKVADYINVRNTGF